MDFKVFYKALGIAGHIVDPTYYHILGLDPKFCDEQAVTEAYRQKRMLLRQTIPGPEFIPMVVRFEKEQLEPAFEVLRNEKRRKAYNQQLLERQKVIEEKNEKKAQLIEDVRRTIAATVDARGMLGDQGRMILTERLRRLGVAEHNIAQILERIPRPMEGDHSLDPGRSISFYTEAVRISFESGMPGPEETGHLLDLAARLGIGHEQAQRILKEGARSRQSDVQTPGKGVPANGASRVVLEGDQPVQLYEQVPGGKSGQPLPIGDSDEQVEPESVTEYLQQQRGLNWERLSHILIPFCTIALFLLIFAGLFLLNQHGRKSDQTPVRENREKLTQTPTQENKAPDAGLQPKTQLPAPNPTVDELKTPQHPGPSQQGNKFQKEDFQAEVVLLRGGFAATDNAGGVMGDIGVLVVSILAELEKLADMPNQWSRFYEGISVERNRRELLVPELEDDIAFSLLPEGYDLALGQAEGRILGAGLENDDLRVRVLTIERLGQIDGGWPEEVLLERLEGIAGSGTRLITAGRILEELSSDNSPALGHRLAEIMGRTVRQGAAHQIQIKLMGLFKEKTGYGNPVILPLRHDARQRRQAAQYWIDQMGINGDPRPYLGDAPAVEPDWLEADLEMTTAAGFLADLLAQKLASIGQDRFEPKIEPFELSMNEDGGTLGRIEKMIHSLAGLVRKAEGTANSVGMDSSEAVLLSMHSSLAECKEFSCRMDVYAEAAVRLVLEYIMLADRSGRYEIVCLEFWKEYEQRRRLAANRLEAAREGFYTQALLWEVAAEAEHQYSDADDTPGMPRPEFSKNWNDMRVKAKGFTFLAGAKALEQRRENQQKEKAILEKLISGLESYLAGDFALARERFESVTDSKWLDQVCQSIRVPVISQIALSSGEFEADRLEEGPKVYCSLCEGTGREKCPQCGGRGQVRGGPVGTAGPEWVKCSRCQPDGSGSLVCVRCEGTGVEPGIEIDDKRMRQGYENARRLLRYAVYLHEGGVRIYSGLEH